MWNQFSEHYEHDFLSKEQIRKILDDYHEWKYNVFSAQWRTDFYLGGCKKCGSRNLNHLIPDYKGRESGWSIIHTIWKTYCMECNCRHTVITDYDNDVVDWWIKTKKA